MTQPIPFPPPTVLPNDEPLPRTPIEQPPVRHDPEVFPEPGPVEEPHPPAPDPGIPVPEIIPAQPPV